MKLNSYQFFKNFVPRLIIISTIILILLTLYFIYKNVWQVFTFSEKNILLQKEVVQAELKIELFKKIDGILESKKNKKEPVLENLINPFGSFQEEVELR